MGILSIHGHSNLSEAHKAWGNGEEHRVGDMKGKRGSNPAVSDMDPDFDSLTAALRQMHDSIASEPIPDDFLDLLDKIDAKMMASKKFS